MSSSKINKKCKKDYNVGKLEPNLCIVANLGMSGT